MPNRIGGGLGLLARRLFTGIVMDNTDEFLEAMQAENSNIVDFFEALMFAMDSVRRHDDEHGIRYFGVVGGGTFYADHDFDHTRWFPDTTLQEAITELWCEFGQEFTEGLDERNEYASFEEI